MDCDAYRRWLSPYVDEALEPNDRAGLEAHLSACASCRAELASLRAMLQTLRAMEAPEAPDLVSGVRRKLARRPWWETIRVPWPAVALAATALLVVVVTGRLPDNRRSAQPMMQLASAKRALASSESRSSAIAVRKEKTSVAFNKPLAGAPAEQAQALMDKVGVMAGIADENGALPMSNAAPAAPPVRDAEPAREGLERVDLKQAEPYAADADRSGSTLASAPVAAEVAVKAWPTMNVAPEDQACQADADCTLVPVSCNGCSCPWPLNVNRIPLYRERFQQLCQAYRGGSCAPSCPYFFVRCADHRCIPSQSPPAPPSPQ